RVCESDTRQVTPITAMRRIGRAVLAQVQRSAPDLELARRQADAISDGDVGGFGGGGDRQRQVRIEAWQAAVEALFEAALVLEAEAEVERQLPGQTPVVLRITGSIRVGQIERIVGVDRER